MSKNSGVLLGDDGICDGSRWRLLLMIVMVFLLLVGSVMFQSRSESVSEEAVELHRRPGGSQDQVSGDDVGEEDFESSSTMTGDSVGLAVLDPLRFLAWSSVNGGEAEEEELRRREIGDSVERFS